MSSGGGGGGDTPHPDQKPVAISFWQTCQPWSWCLKVPEHPARKVVTAIVTILHCLALCLFDPCADQRDALLLKLDYVFFVYFLIETVILVLAHSVKGYLVSNWNKLDALILFSEFLGYVLLLFSWDAAVVVDPLRPLRLIRRIPSLRTSLEIILGTFPMFLRVTLLIALFHLIFGVMSVQLWKGQLSSRCFLGPEAESILQAHNKTMSEFYNSPNLLLPFLCSTNDKDGRHCSDVPSTIEQNMMCHASPQSPSEWSNSTCVDWNSLYSECRRGPQAPYRGAVNFDDIGHALITIFQVITLEGWSEVMYFVMDAYSFWSFLFFILVTVIGAFVMTNVMAVVISTEYGKCSKEHAQNEASRGSTALQMALSCLRYLQEKYRCPYNFQRIHVHKLKKIVDSHIFDRTILVTVCLSILLLAMEYHNQPKQLTEILHVCNIVINVIFIVEMVMRILADSNDYFTKMDTLADFFIVMASSIEMMLTSKGVLAMLRAFRLLRLVRLIKFLPMLRKQVHVLTQTMIQAISLVFLMVLFVFIFSLLGCHLFGCKFKFLTEAGHWRKNFDSVPWGMVTVFQILTLEDWNYVLYNAMAATSLWSAIYFVVVIMLGNNLFLNVLVGIVVDKFHSHKTQDVESSEEQDDGAAEHTLGGLRAGETSPEDAPVPWCHIRIPQWVLHRETYSLFLFSPRNRFRLLCQSITSSTLFERFIMLLICLSCITLAMERPSLHPESTERFILTYSDYVFAGLFLMEMIFKVISLGLVMEWKSYGRDPWNVLDGLLVILSCVGVIITLSDSNNSDQKSVLGVLRVLRLLRILRPLRVLKHFPWLKLAINALLASVAPIANIILISGVFMFLYAILGVQIFSGAFSNCVDERFQDVRNNINITNEATCLMYNHTWSKRTYNFDNIFQALMSLFVMYSKDGWVNIMYDGIDAAGKNVQPVTNFRQWIALYFISFMIISYFLLDILIGTLVDTWFCKVQHDPELVEVVTVKAKRKRRQTRSICGRQCEASRYLPILEKILTVVIFVNLFVMAIEHNDQPKYVEVIMNVFFYVAMAIFIFELLFKLWVLGLKELFSDWWILLELVVVVGSIVSLLLSVLHLEDKLPFNPSIVRSLRLLSLAHAMKFHKIQVLIRTVGKTLAHGANLCSLFGFFFFIYAILTVELYGKIECTEDYPCGGLNRYSNFQNFPMALLTLFRLCTGDNWNGILKDTLRKCRPGDPDCMDYLWWASPLCLISFTVIVQFVLVNLIVAAIMEAQEQSSLGSPTVNNVYVQDGSSSSSDSEVHETYGNWLDSWDSTDSPESRAEAPESRAESPESRAEAPESRADSPENRAESPESRAESPENRAESPENRAESPESWADSPESRADSPESRAESPQEGRYGNRPDSEPPESRADSPNDRVETWSSEMWSSETSGESQE